MNEDQCVRSPKASYQQHEQITGPL